MSFREPRRLGVSPGAPYRIPGAGHPPGAPTGPGPPETPSKKKGAPNHVIFGYVGGPVGGIPEISGLGSRDTSAGWERPRKPLAIKTENPKSVSHQLASRPPTGGQITNWPAQPEMPKVPEPPTGVGLGLLISSGLSHTADTRPWLGFHPPNLRRWRWLGLERAYSYGPSRRPRPREPAAAARRTSNGKRIPPFLSLSAPAIAGTRAPGGCLGPPSS